MSSKYAHDLKDIKCLIAGIEEPCEGERCQRFKVEIFPGKTVLSCKQMFWSNELKTIKGEKK